MVKKNTKRKLHRASGLDYAWYFILILLISLIFAYTTFEMEVRYMASKTKNNLYFCADNAISLNLIAEQREHVFNRKDIIVNYNDNTSQLNVTTKEKNELNAILGNIQENFISLFHLNEHTHVAEGDIYKVLCGENRIDITKVVIYQPIYVEQGTVKYDEEGVPYIDRTFSFTKVRIYTCNYSNGMYSIPSTSDIVDKVTLGSEFDGAKIDITIGLNFYGIKNIFAEATPDGVFDEHSSTPFYSTSITQSLDVVTINNDNREHYGT